ncbi:unnamed protein product [Lupinus luteus]|uniref:MYB-CC type transcription factor LHEQLE-containing domain-containing protein n=1 Tax=Lupinus luteus TaxID=3873 RepID=A0AAV1YB64_LUPLU
MVEDEEFVIEVQKHMQLMIEAEGKYLQTVLKKAQEALIGYNSSTVDVEVAKSELSNLISIINKACLNSPLIGERKQNRGTMSFLEISLTSSETEKEEEKKPQKSNTISFELPLITIHPEDDKEFKVHNTSDADSVRKRSVATTIDSDDIFVDKAS